MIYYHKNPTIKTILHVIKIQYRDSKRIKFRGVLLNERLLPIWYTESYTVGPKFLTNFQTEVPKLVPDHEDLLKLDEEKESYILSQEFSILLE